jgi:hypothetical protein
MTARHDHIITINMPGFEPYQTTITRDVRWWVWAIWYLTE